MSFSSAFRFSPIYFIYFTGYTPNGVKWRGKRSLHFNKTRVKSHNSKNKGKSPLETKTGARTPSSLIQMVCLLPHLRREKMSFWWKDILRLHVYYRGIAVCDPKRGDTISFWNDLFLGEIQSLKYLNLFQFSLDTNISVMKIRQTEQLLNCFRIPMTRR